MEMYSKVLGSNPSTLVTLWDDGRVKGINMNGSGRYTDAKC